MKFIKQPDARGCCVACAAMLSGRSYEDVLDDQARMWGTQERVFQLRFVDWRAYLDYLGFETGFYEAEGPLLEAIGQLPKDARFFCSIGLLETDSKYDPQNSHAILIDENGLVFDPAADGPAAFDRNKYTGRKRLLIAVSVHDRRTMKNENP